MATWDDVREIAMSLPQSVEGTGRDGLMQWWVRGRLFVWERPLRKPDLAALGDSAPTGDILGIRCPSLVAKEALLQTNPHVYFTTPHFDGYPAILVRLSRISKRELRELIVEAWLCRAPAAAARAYREKG